MATKRKIKKYYCADFETTTATYSQDETRVWCYYIENIFDQGDNGLGVSINGFFDFIETFQFDTNIYFHNLNFDGEFLLNYLCDNYIHKPTEVGQFQTTLQRGEWTNLSDGVSSHYVIQFKTNTHNVRVKFLCSYKQLMTSVSTLMGVVQKDKIDYNITTLPNSINDLTQEQITYIKKDVKTVIPYMANLLNSYKKSMGITSSGTAIKLVKSYLPKGEFDKMFKNKIKAGYINERGLYVDGEWDWFKKGYLGGFTFLKQSMYRSIQEYIRKLDVNSLYPAVMYYEWLPYNKPYYDCKRKNCNHGKFYEINITADIKPDCLPFIPSGSGYEQHITYEAHPKNHLIYVTDKMLECIYRWYDVKQMRIIKEAHFKMRQDIFKEHIDAMQDMKQQALKGSFQYLFSKLMQNQVYGKFGMTPLRRKYYFRPFNPETDTRKNLVKYGSKNVYVSDYQYDLSEPAYIPMALWITSLAKIKTIDLMNMGNSMCKCYSQDGAYIYSDTDSCHFTMCDTHFNELSQLIEIHPTKLGAWDLEGTYRYGFYGKRKLYLDYNNPNDNIDPRNCALAGITKDSIDQYTYKDVIDALMGQNSPYTPTKRTKLKVKGGIIFIDKEVNVNDN